MNSILKLIDMINELSTHAVSEYTKLKKERLRLQSREAVYDAKTLKDTTKIDALFKGGKDDDF